MRLSGLRARKPRRYVVTTHSRHREPVAPNLLQRDFCVGRPNQVWLSDITYIRCGSSWVYLCVVLNLKTRSVVGWAVSHRIDQELTIAALRQAIDLRKPPKGLILHSDRGVQYAAARAFAPCWPSTRYARA